MVPASVPKSTPSRPDGVRGSYSLAHLSSILSAYLFLVSGVQEHRKNFTNLISRQGTLVENLELERRRAQELEDIVHQKEMSDNSSQLATSRVIDMRRDVATQTNPSDIPISNQVILE